MPVIPLPISALLYNWRLEEHRIELIVQLPYKSRIKKGQISSSAVNRRLDLEFVVTAIINLEAE
jgi:hypothetical protein